MELKVLGSTGVKIPEIGLGTWQARSVEALRLGISLGAHFIDTAEMYGTEEIVARAIAGAREGVFLATKVSPNHFRYDDVLKAAKNSLKMLGTSYIDLYQLHWPSENIPIGETMKAMERLVKQGSIRHIGISNFSVAETKEAQEALAHEEIVSNQVEYNLLNREIEKDLLLYCESQGISIIAYSPLARGGLAKASLRNRALSAALAEVARAEGRTVAQVALNWVTTGRNVVAIPKADKIEDVSENVGASGWRLSAEHHALIDRSSRNYLGNNP